MAPDLLVAVAVPESETDSAVPPAVKVREAEMVPGATGRNVTVIVHDAPAAREVPQVVVSEKSAAFAPLTEGAVSAAATLELVFVRVIT